MKPITFVRIADMKYYCGVTQRDTPFNGGSYVKETGNAHECYNFGPIIQDGQSYEKCIGFFMLSGGSGAGQLHIENIAGCELMIDYEQEYVLVRGSKRKLYVASIYGKALR